MATVVRRLASDGVASRRSITYAIFGWFQEMTPYQPVFQAYSAILDRFF